MATQSVNFFAPGTEAGMDFGQVQRQRAMAEALMRASSTQQQGQMVGNRYVPPSSLSYVNQLASAIMGGMMQKRADQSERDILQQSQQRRAAEAAGFMEALNGRAGTTQEAAGPWGGDVPPPTQTVGAAAPDRAKALALALQSSNPALQAMGGELMKRQMSEQELASIMAQYGGGAGGASPGGGAAGAPSAAGGPGAAPAGGVAGVNPLAFALAASGRDKLGSMIQDASKPLNVTEGGTIWNPQTGQAMFTAPKTEAGIGVRNGSAAPIPGFAEAQAHREALQAQARQAAESANTMVTVDVGGKPTQMTRAQFLALSNGTQPSGPVNGQPIPNPMAPRPGDSDRAQIYQQERMQIAQQMKDAQARGDQAAFARAQQDAIGLEKEIKSNKISLDPMPIPGIVGQTAEQKAYGDTRAKDFAAQAGAFQKGGQQAASTLRSLDELKTLYADPNVAKGALAENISGLKNVGASFGVDMKGLSSEQAAAAITNKMALDLRSTADGGGMPGAMSDADREFLKALTPNLTKSPEGRAKIMEAQQKVAQRQIDAARLANEYEQRNGRLDAGFDKVLQDYAAKNRMFTQAQPGGGSKTNVDALLNKYR